MIGQYLSNTNEIATVSISQKILELNKAGATVQALWWDLKTMWEAEAGRCRRIRRFHASHARRLTWDAPHLTAHARESGYASPLGRPCRTCPWRWLFGLDEEQRSAEITYNGRRILWCEAVSLRPRGHRVRLRRLSIMAWFSSQNFLVFGYCTTFVYIWQILSNQGVTRLKRFIS